MRNYQTLSHWLHLRHFDNGRRGYMMEENNMTTWEHMKNADGSTLELYVYT